MRPGEQVEFDTAFPHTGSGRAIGKNPFDKWVGIAKGAFPGGLKDINASDTRDGGGGAD